MSRSGPTPGSRTGPTAGSSAGTGLSKRAVVWLSAATTVSFVVALLLMAFGPDVAETTAGDASTFSHSALGHRALRELLTRCGVNVNVRRSPRLSLAGPQTPVIIAEPRVERASPGARSPLDDALRLASHRRAPVVLVLPKWHAVVHSTPEGPRVRDARLRSRRSVEESVESPEIRNLDRLRVVRPPSLAGYDEVSVFGPRGFRATARLLSPQVLDDSDSDILEPLFRTKEGVLVGRLHHPEDARSDVWIVSDPDLLNNHGIGQGDNAVIVHQLIVRELGAVSVEVDEIVHGHERTLSFYAEMLRLPLVLSVAHGALVLVLALWAGMGRFGKPRAAPPRVLPGKLELIETTSSLLGHRGRSLHSAGRYLEEAVLEIARYYHLPGDLPRGELRERLQRISDARGVEVSLEDLRQRLEAAGGGREPSEEVARRIAMEIHRWRREMMDGR